MAVLTVAIPSAFAQNCLETISCAITTPLTFFLQPFLLLMGDWTYVVFWGIIGGIIYNRSQNLMLVGFIGILVGTSLISQNVLSQSFNSIPMVILMIGAGVGFVLYSLWKNRLNGF